MNILKNRIVAVVYAVIAVIILSAELCAQDIPSKPFPARTVNDYANILEREQNVDLERKLCAYWDSTHVQLVVVIVPTLGGYEASEYAVKLHREWGVGDADKNNGIVILVKPKTEEEYGDVFISIGYGLEGDIPDAYADRIIERIMIPQFINEDYYLGIDLACDALVQLATGGSLPVVEDTLTDEDTSTDIITEILFWLIIIGLPAMIIVFILQIFGVIKSGGGGGGSGGDSSGTTYRSSGSSGSYRSYGGGSAGGGGAGRRW